MLEKVGWNRHYSWQMYLPLCSMTVAPMVEYCDVVSLCPSTMNYIHSCMSSSNPRSFVVELVPVHSHCPFKFHFSFFSLLLLKQSGCMRWGPSIASQCCSTYIYCHCLVCLTFGFRVRGSVGCNVSLHPVQCSASLFSARNILQRST